jgi:hypothetical protein
MLHGIGLYYGNWRQKYDSKLEGRLKEIISSKDPRILVCFNPEFILKTKAEFKVAGIPNEYQFWTNSKMFLKDYYHKDVIYGSALCFNPKYNTHIDYQKLKTFFLTKNVIIIASNIKRFENIKLGKTTDLIEGPASDAWQHYDEIKDSLFAMIQNKNYDKKDILVLASTSTASKILTYDLTKLGYTSWDTGQFFDLAFKEIQKNLNK